MASYSDFLKYKNNSERQKQSRDELLVAEFLSKEFTPLMDCFYKNVKKAVDKGDAMPCFSCRLIDTRSTSEKETIENGIIDELQKQGWNMRFKSYQLQYGRKYDERVRSAVDISDRYVFFEFPLENHERWGVHYEVQSGIMGRFFDWFK